ncbi:hypothetical protein JXA80_00115, partial [bacterium]|nr:hypothetical protein [candidate division CSSED10-310 bacterium]
VSGGTPLILETPADNTAGVAVDSIRLHRISAYRFHFWRTAARILRALEQRRFAVACMCRAFLSAPGDPWYELKTRLPGAHPRTSDVDTRHPLPDDFIDTLLADAGELESRDLHTLEFVLGVPLIRLLPGHDIAEYIATGIAMGWTQSARMAITHDFPSPESMETTMIRIAAFALLDQSGKAVRHLDDALLSGALFPMQLSRPSGAMTPLDPLFAIMQDLESRPAYQDSARFVTNGHLVKAVSAFHRSAIQEGARAFDAFYLSDHGVFMETIPNMPPDFCREMFRYASRIYPGHVNALIENSLNRHRPVLALAVADYGYRMFPANPDIVLGRARTLFHLQQYTEARKLCLDFIARFLTDDRGRWLAEQILIQTREKSRRTGMVMPAAG